MNFLVGILHIIIIGNPNVMVLTLSNHIHKNSLANHFLLKHNMQNIFHKLLKLIEIYKNLSQVERNNEIGLSIKSCF
jgi:hypothetical protein